ncbi:MAG: hypothetical protein ACE5G2_07210 [Candidatus Krumholzibacteriia bacterium]
MRFSYYRRLSARQRRIYDKSDAVGSLRMPSPERLAPHIEAVARELGRADRAATETAVRRFTMALLEALRVPGVRVRVLAARPSHDWGELHGLYEPEEGRKPLVTVWMRTAQRRQPVAFKTFLRTLLHEIGHHLDYELLGLEDSFHTQGFYKRESSLFRQLVPDPALYEPPKGKAGRGRTLGPANAKPAETARRPSGPRRRPAGVEQASLPFEDA